MVAAASGPGRPRRSSSRARSRRAPRRAPAALVEAEVGRLWAESSRAADDADAQRKSVTGQPQGQPHPTYFRPRRPLVSATRLRPSSDLSAVLATAAGAVKAHMYR